MSIRRQKEQALLNRPVPLGFPAHAMLPEYAGRSIASVPALARHLLGLSVEDRVLAGEITADSVDRVILLILDGVGYRKLMQVFHDHPGMAMRALAERGTCLPITSVFPSTTVTALTSYSTGLTPQQHGMIGYRLYLRETQSITNMIQLPMLDPAPGAHPRVTAESLLPMPTVYEEMEAAGVRTHTLLPSHISGSGLSRVLYRGCGSTHPVVNFADMLVTARQILSKATAKTFLSLYWPGPDSIAHTRGPETESYLAELLSIDEAIRRELLGRVENTLLLICSDHGFVPMRSADYLRLSDLPDLSAGLLLPPVGEPRASYLFLRHRNGSGDRAHAPTELPNGLVQFTAAEAVQLGLFGHGDLHPEFTHRLGDLIVVSTGAAGVYHPYPGAPLLPGMHGGLTPEEMLVPLLASRL